MQSATPSIQFHPSRRLLDSAAALRRTPYFSSEGADSPIEKQLIFYALAGVKPVSEVASFHAAWLSPEYAESRGDDQAGVAALLDSLGLHYDFRLQYDGIVAVSANAQSIAEHRRFTALVARLRTGPPADATAIRRPPSMPP